MLTIGSISEVWRHTHRHMWQGALRNSLPDGLLGDYVRVVLGARVHYRPEDVHIGNLVSALGAMDAGVTTVLDWSHIGNSPAHTDAAIAGLREAGIPPVQHALDHGIRPSLSVDVETQMAGDMFRQMLSIFTLQRMQVLARQRAKEPDVPPLLTVREVVEMATIQGARDNGLAQRTGSLAPGKQADVILLDRSRINVMPVNDP